MFVSFLATVIACLLIYLLLTIGSGSFLGFWSTEEILVGTAISVIVAAIFSRHVLWFSRPHSKKLMHPFRWLLAAFYFVGPFIFSIAHANIDVAYRVITGKINPAIVKINPGIKGGIGQLMLANSITLTPCVEDFI